ncbi:MAG: hypothetical protein WCP35_07445 [Verrucomicrobiota bacterium]
MNYDKYTYLCEARKPGQASHHFAVVSGDAARALCDLNGWELIRVYEPGKDSDRPESRPAKGDGPLSKKQLTCLVTEANKTWRQQSNMGLIAETFAEWRHAQVYAQVRREGLSKCQSSHYLKLLDHFRSMRGEKTRGAWSGGQRRQSREGGDTAERRDQVIHHIAAELGRHAAVVEDPKTMAESVCAAHATMKGGVIGEEYLMAIARGKNPGQSLVDVGCLIKLPASRLEQLLYTLRNRIAAREGRGVAAKRNKNP